MIKNATDIQIAARFFFLAGEKSGWTKNLVGNTVWLYLGNSSETVRKIRHQLQYF